MIEHPAAWKPIGSFNEPDGELVDLWLNVYASPMSMGMADKWRAIDCYRQDGEWFDSGGKLEARYITHWSPRLPPPTDTR